MKLFEGLADAVAAEGIQDMFGLMGDGNLFFWSALAKRGGIDIYSARNEAGAVAMADGYYRSSGRLGFATITCGPGLTQVGTSLVAAARNRTPMVLFIGEIAVRDRFNLQKFDQRRFAQACEAQHVAVKTLENAADDIAEAFFLARTQRCPVVLDIPNDLQEAEMDWEWDYRPSLPFAPRYEATDDTSLDALVAMLEEAQQPVLIAGRGARNPAVREELIKLAGTTGALLATTLQAKGLFEGSSRNIGVAGSYATAPAEGVLGDADLVLGVGAEIGHYTSEGGLLFPNARIARIDIMPPRHLGVLPGLHLKGDALKTVQALNDRLAARAFPRRGINDHELAVLLDGPPPRYETCPDGMNPRIVMRELSYAIPENAVITSGGGHFLGFVGMHLPVPSDADFQVSLQFGAVGQTLPIAVGVAAANPGRPHLVIEGDGSILMNIQELETLIRHELPTVILLLNDGGYGAEVHKLARKGFDGSLAQWVSPDFVALTRALGGDGELVVREEDVAPAVARGFAKGGVFLIDARISPTELSDAYQKVQLGVPNSVPFVRYSRKGIAVS